MSSLPNSETARSTMASMSDATDTSARIADALPPSSAIAAMVFAASSVFTSAIRTLAPSCVSRTARRPAYAKRATRDDGDFT